MKAVCMIDGCEWLNQITAQRFLQSTSIGNVLEIRT